MDIDFSAITEYQRYKLMASLIVPRPIALITTLSEDGVVNAAPFSMFNMLGEEPPIVMVSINRLQDSSNTRRPTSRAPANLWCTWPMKPWQPRCTAAANVSRPMSVN